MKFASAGNKSAAKLIDIISNKENADKLLKIFNKETLMMSGEEALALLIDANLTKHTYQLLRNKALEKNHHLYPPYNQVLRQLFQ